MANEEQDLNRFIKFFCLKSIQVIALSRSNFDKYAPGKPNKAQWFNLDLPENESIRSQAKEALDRELPTTGHPLIVEVFIIRNDQSILTLETWRIGRTEQCDVSIKVKYGVYNRLGLLLKSLLSLTRCLPTYKFCKENFKSISTRFYIEHSERRISTNEEFIVVKFGSVSTPYGSITMAVSYMKQIKNVFIKPDIGQLELLHSSMEYDNDNKHNSEIALQRYVSAAFGSKSNSQVPSQTSCVPFEHIITKSLTASQFPEEKISHSPQTPDSATIEVSQETGFKALTSSSTDDYVFVSHRAAFASSSDNSEVHDFYGTVNAALRSIPTLPDIQSNPKHAFSDLISQYEHVASDLESFIS